MLTYQFLLLLLLLLLLPRLTTRFLSEEHRNHSDLEASSERVDVSCGSAKYLRGPLDEDHFLLKLPAGHAQLDLPAAVYARMCFERHGLH